MPSNVDICNFALLHIGVGSTIASLTEESAEARACARIFDLARDATLRDHGWNFATKYQSLAEVGSPPEEWGYKFRYPVDCLKALRLSSGVRAGADIKYKIIADSSLEGRVILCDVNPAVLEYTARVVNPESFDPLFIEALSLRIAALVAFSLTGKSRLRSDALALYQEVLGNARLADSQEGRLDDLPDPDWIGARA